MRVSKVFYRIGMINSKLLTNIRKKEPAYFRNTRYTQGGTSFLKRYLSTDGEEKPLTYSRSKAAQWRSIDSIAGVEIKNDTPPSQLYAVLGSVAVFLIYFCILREENDIDLELNKNLSEYVKGLDESSIQK